MKKKIIISFLLISSLSFSQKEKLENIEQKKFFLKDAVLNQYRSFYPRVSNNFQWIPNSNNYSTFSPMWNEVLVFDYKGNKLKSVSLSEINNSLESKLKWLSGFQWKNNNEFYLKDEENIYLFNVDTKSGKKLFSLKENSQNSSLNKRNQQVYTIENNIGIFNGKKHLLSTKIKDKNIVSGQAIARSEFGITKGLFWSPTGNKVGFYQKDESHVHDYPLLDVNSTPGTLNSVKYPMAGQMSEKPKVGIIMMNNGRVKYLKTFGNEEDHYLTNFGWGPKEKYVYIAEVNRNQDHMQLLKYNAKNGKLEKVLFEEKNQKWVEPEHPVFFLKNNTNQFVWMSERDGFMNLYLYDTEGNLIKQLTKNKWVAQEILGMDKKGENLIFQGTGENPLNTMIYKVNIKSGKQELITKIEGTHNASLSKDGSYLFDSYSNHNIPKIEQIIDLDGNTIQQLGEANNPLKNHIIGNAEISTIKSNDGKILYTRMIKPSHFDSNKKYPVLVYVYGGPHAQMIKNSWLDGASLWMYWLAEQGYLVYTVDNRGSANRGFDFESIIHRNLGKNEMEDQILGVDYLKILPYVDANRLAVYGWSFGGYMTTSLMLKYPGVFTTGVAGGPVTDWKFYEAMYGERYMDKPEQNKKGYEETNLSNYVKNLEGNLLLIHGTIDDVVVMQHNLKLIQEFVNEGIQVDFFAYPMHKHNVRGKDRLHLLEKVLNYIMENNK